MKKDKKSPDGRSGLIKKSNNKCDNYNSDKTQSPHPFGNLKDIEQSVLRSVFSGEVDFGELKLHLDSEDFYSTAHRLVFGAMDSLYRDGKAIDLLCLSQELEDNEQRPDGGSWSQYLTNVLDVALELAAINLEYYIKIIKDASQTRKLEKTAYDLHEAASRGDTDEVKRLTDIVNEVQLSDERALRLKPISAKDLPDTPPPESLWAGLLFPGCITQLNAEPGAGKSTFAYNIAALGAQDKEFLGMPFSKPLKTLYVDLETAQWLQRKKILDISGELPDDFYLQSELNLGLDFNIFLRECRKNKYHLVILDTQSKVLAMEDENSNSEATRAGLLLEKIARQTGVAILLIHHTKKNDGGKGVYRGRGASATAGGVAIVANFETLDPETVQLVIEKSRMPVSYQSITMRKIGNDRFELVRAGMANDRTELHRIQDFILNLLSDRAEWQTADIHQRCENKGFKTRTIQQALKRLVESGRIIRIKQGVYVLSKEFSDGFLDHDEYDIPEELN